jgi:collagen beta-1,O-galactosyltransferase
MDTFVVNLARRPDRRARMERILPPEWHAEFTTNWDGPLDGAAIRPGDLDDVALFDWELPGSDNPWWSRPLKLGEIGCAMSHWSIWRRAAERRSELTVVLEDDVSVVDDVARELDRRIDQLDALDENWDLVYLGRWAQEPENDHVVASGIVRPGYSFCTFGYALRPSGLRKLLGVAYERALIPVDELLPALSLPHRRPDVRRRYPPCMTTYAFEPPLVEQLPKDVAGSDTEASASVTARDDRWRARTIVG